MALMKTIGFCFFVIILTRPGYAQAWVSSVFAEKEYKVNSVLDKDAMLVRSSVRYELVNVSTQGQALEIGFNLPDGALLSKFQVEENSEWISAKRVTTNVEKYFDSGRAKRGAKTKFTAILFKEQNNYYNIRISPIAQKKSIRIRYQVTLPIHYKDGRYFHELLRHDPTRPIVHKADYAYRVLGRKRGPNETHILAADACVLYGAPHGCRILEIDVPEGQTAKTWSLRMDQDTGKNKLAYRVVVPSGKTVSSGFFTNKIKEKPIHFKEGIILPSGIWKVVLWTRAEKVSVTNLRIESENQSMVVGKGSVEIFKIRGKPTVEILDAFSDELKKSKLLYSQVKLGRKTFTKADFFAVKSLSVLPKHPLMIFLLDTSISQGESGVANQLKVIESIRGNTKDEDAVIIAFNRNARVLFDAGKLKAETMKLENGSNIDLAFNMAQEVIKKKGGTRPVFIYALSDFEFKGGINSETIMPLVKRIPKSTVIHTIEPGIRTRSMTAIHRDDGNILAKLASQFNGFSARFDTIEGRISAADTLHFVRPIRFDLFEFTGLKKLPFVSEGVSINPTTWKSSPKKMEVHAKLWAKDFHVEVESNPALQERTAGHMLNDEQLSRAQILTLSKRTKAATVLNSFIIKGSTPRREIRRAISMNHGRPNIGHSGMARMVKGRGMALLRPDYFSDVAKWCSMAFSPDKDIAVDIETVRFEIVDVRTGTSGFEKCVADGIWKTHLKDNNQTIGTKLYFSPDGNVSLYRAALKSGTILKK